MRRFWARMNGLRGLSREDNLDSLGGGTIIRTFYCEPYTSFPRLVTALKGTITPGLASAWSRTVPHADPVYPWFYCTDTHVVPSYKQAARSMPSRGFDPSAGSDSINSQLMTIRSALDVYDDFDGSATIDNLSPQEIIGSPGALPPAGAPQFGVPAYNYSTNDNDLNTGESVRTYGFKSRGAVGAIVTATYKPLLFLQGVKEPTSGVVGGFGGPWDYVDPQWEPITVNTQLGRQLWLYAPDVGGTPNTFDGLSDTYARPEVIWRFSCRRLMVPFIPVQTLSLFSNKVNAGGTLGNLTINPQTWRMETPEIETGRTPDGNLYHNIRLKFLVRTLWDTAFSFSTNQYSTAPVPITWNHAYGIPTVSIQGGLSNFTPGYYPVVWNDGILQIFGKNRPVFLRDSDVDMSKIANNAALTQSLFGAPFQAGTTAAQ